MAAPSGGSVGDFSPLEDLGYEDAVGGLAVMGPPPSKALWHHHASKERDAEDGEGLVFGSSFGTGGGPVSFPGSGCGDLSEVTLRRSSQSSQFGCNRPSSNDSYDPISADMSRRSSQNSQFGGGNGPLSLTPAHTTASRQRTLPLQEPVIPVRRPDYPTGPHMQRYNSMGTLNGAGIHAATSTAGSRSQTFTPARLPPSGGDAARTQITVPPPPQHQQAYYQRRMAAVRTSTNLPHQGGASSNMGASSPRDSKGRMDASELCSKVQARGNRAVLQQNFRSVHLSSNQQTMQKHVHATTCKRLEPEPGEGCLQSSDLHLSPCRLKESLYDRNGNSTHPVKLNLSSATCRREPVHFADAGFQVKGEDCDESITISDQQNMTSQNPLHLHPTPPTGPRPLTRHLSGSRHQSNANQDVASAYRVAFSDFTAARTLRTMPCSTQGGFKCLSTVGTLTVLLVPAVNAPLSESNAASSNRAPADGGLTPEQIDFDRMLEDDDGRRSLQPGRATWRSEDMSSLLSALAEESKFLTSMS
ncbi:hypothetical protein KUCAC02_037690 [Chaenocephalus aceratus]|nr:hypothetical protein KUCAC02_037690 [Chaenocephalus aceratus]